MTIYTVQANVVVIHKQLTDWDLAKLCLPFRKIMVMSHEWEAISLTQEGVSVTTSLHDQKNRKNSNHVHFGRFIGFSPYIY